MTLDESPEASMSSISSANMAFDFKREDKSPTSFVRSERRRPRWL